ncbi:hypothetical protein P691DRAFT_781762 [Macrolepiota fuliginosa MF-IS2]|uniref:Uncharacterized protein n=1 Tax=Macrolepiota fuliginosa MF-IS2 TaxID=1400762 RepID=A0A9P5XAT1_9AGAR|nr:hypothetical protein P691DRAFT_781762 [Macrolepiota fuliginosa MF-IS2]
MKAAAAVVVVVRWRLPPSIFLAIKCGRFNYCVGSLRSLGEFKLSSWIGKINIRTSNTSHFSLKTPKKMADDHSSSDVEVDPVPPYRIVPDGIITPPTPVPETPVSDSLRNYHEIGEIEAAIARNFENIPAAAHASTGRSQGVNLEQWWVVTQGRHPGVYQDRCEERVEPVPDKFWTLPGALAECDDEASWWIVAIGYGPGCYYGRTTAERAAGSKAKHAVWKATDEHSAYSMFVDCYMGGGVLVIPGGEI